MDQVTVLFLAANPSMSASNRLALDEEYREIGNKVRGSEYPSLLTFKSRWAVRPDDLIQALNEEHPQIVHFSGHGGGETGLILHDDSWKATSVAGSSLALLFKVVTDNIRLVFLNACYSQEQAQSISEVIDCVIGMKSSVLDDTAITFAASFYRALGFGRSVRNAFDQGLVAIALSNIDEQDIPILIMREGVDPDTVFFPERKKSLTLSKRNLGERIEVTKGFVNYMDQQSGDHFLNYDLPRIVANIGDKLPCKSLIMIDIDELTIINKVFKQPVGNKVLSTVLDLIMENSNTDFVGRCGDDTYYVFLPGLSAVEAKKTAESLRLSIQNYDWQIIASQLRVTCSSGISELHQDEPVIDWVVRATCGMILAKQSGRNRAIFGPDYLSVRQSRGLRDYFSGKSYTKYPEGDVTFQVE